MRHKPKSKMKRLLFILLTFLIFTACKKEEEVIEKNLWNKKGEWIITSLESSRTSNLNSSGNFNKVIMNPGTAKFEKDGTGIMNYNSEMKQFLTDVSFSGIIDVPYTYYLTDKSIFFIYGNTKGLGFDLNWEKNKMNFGRTEITEEYVNDGNNNPILEIVTFSIQFNCEKK